MSRKLKKDRTVHLLFEAAMLKRIPRSGYAFLGAGRESVAEHSFSTAFIALVLSHLEPRADGRRLVAMSLLHDLAETRTGDLNPVQKRYVTATAPRALAAAVADTPLALEATALNDEFEAGETLEALLARDADQLAFLIELRFLGNLGLQPADKWAGSVQQRLKTRLGRRLARQILCAASDDWWLESIVDSRK